MNSPLRRAKIVATLGPASSDAGTIAGLITAGVNVFRFNFSHGTKADHEARFKIVRDTSKRLGKAVAILQDLQGPKLRVGKFPGGAAVIAAGETVTLVLEDSGDVKGRLRTPLSPTEKHIPYNYENLAVEIEVGHRILMDDGNLEVRVTAIKGREIEAEVVYGGTLKDHKGMNFPDTRLTIASFTPKDQEDLAFGIQLGVDYVALSFVRTAADIKQIQDVIKASDKIIPVVAKIEMAEAITNLSEILDFTDAVMVARGDLAVEVGTAQVPTLQKKIIKECRRRGIPVITATQMLESMINTPRPTRAEASDVANAVLDGTDALMLSAETASGKYPIMAVQVMSNIISETEGHWASVFEDTTGGQHDAGLVEAIEHAASRLATWIEAKAIACTTHSGKAARALARFRPKVPIIAFTDSAAVRRRLALIWGVDSVQIEPNADIDKIFTHAEVELARQQIVRKGDRIVLTAGWPPLQHGTTSMVKVVVVRSDYKP